MFRCSRIGFTAVACCSAAAALGQTTLGTSANPESAEATAEREEIVVTARRREERLQDVPVAVSAISAEQLDTAHIESVRQLTEVVPGFTGGRTFAVFQPNIRGVGSTGVSLTDESNVALYVDGVYQPSSLGNVMDLVEVERVEVLKGPQGTLFGRNATGGLVNIITPEPSFDTRGQLAAQYGSFKDAGEETFRAYFTAPLSETFAFDVAGLYRTNDGYISELARGGKTGDARLGHVRSQLMFQPSDSAKVILSVSYNDTSDHSANTIQPLNRNTVGASVPGTIIPSEPFDVALSFEPVVDIEATNVALRTDFDLGAVSLATTSSYLSDRIRQASDTDGSSVVAAQNDVHLADEAVTQEVRLLSDGDGNFNWIAGLYYFKLDADADAFITNGIPPTYATAASFTVSPTASVEAWAAFGEGTLALADAVRLTVGVRYNSEEREFQQRFQGAPVFPSPAKFDDSQTTYRGTVQYLISERNNVYATYSTGFKSGVFNTYSVSPQATDPEEVKAIEIGAKTELVPGVLANIALFNYDYTDLQVTGRVPNGSVFQLLNADEARVRGVELEVNGRTSARLAIRGSLTWLDAEYRSFPNAQVFVPLPGGGNQATTADVSGNKMVRSPEFTASLGAIWTQQLGAGELRLTGNVFYSDQVYYDFGNRIIQPSYTTLSGEVSWTTPRGWRVYLYGRNLSDEEVLQQVFSDSFSDSGTYERAREIGAGLEVTF